MFFFCFSCSCVKISDVSSFDCNSTIILFAVFAQIPGSAVSAEISPVSIASLSNDGGVIVNVYHVLGQIQLIFNSFSKRDFCSCVSNAKYFTVLLVSSR